MSVEVHLRRVKESDLAILFEHQSDPDALRMAAFEFRDLPAFMAHWRNILADERNTIRAILVEGALAGYVVAFELDGRTCVGYWLGKAHWGKGIATSALTAFLDLVRTRPLHAHVAVRNAASIRVLEKCGFAAPGGGSVRSATDGVEELVFVLEG